MLVCTKTSWNSISKHRLTFLQRHIHDPAELAEKPLSNQSQNARWPMSAPVVSCRGKKFLWQPRGSGGFFGFETSLIEVCRSSCLQMRLQIVANHQMVWVNPLSISSLNSMFRLVSIENDISLWFLLTIHSLTQPRTSGWPRIRISSGEILACRRVQCFCVRLKRNWGGEGEDMLCLFSPSRLCPDLSNSVQLSRKKTLSRCMFWNSSCPEQDPKSSWMPSHSSQNKLTIITLLVLESLCQKTEKTFKLNGESTSSHEAILQDL